MRWAGIDIGKERHVVAVRDQDETVLVPATPFAEDAAGYATVQRLLGAPDAVQVVCEATGHYWQNLFATLVAAGYAVTLLNPLQSRRYAEQDLPRAKTDAIDALMLARLGAERRPAPTRLPDAATEELRELVRLRDRWVQELGDRVRQLHRLVDLGFPEFRRTVHDLDSALATTLLGAYPTAAAFRTARPAAVAALCYDGTHTVGRARAAALCAAAAQSVGQHHGPAYQLQVETLCEDIARLRARLRQLDGNLTTTLEHHEVGRLLTTIDGIGTTTAARLVAELGDPAAFRSAAALASYIGAVPQVRHSGRHTPLRASLTPLGHARLRHALWMPVLTAVRRNPWLRAFYQGLRARGKAAKVALMAAMRKLIGAIYSVAKHRRPFVPRVAAPPIVATA